MYVEGTEESSGRVVREKGVVSQDSRAETKVERVPGGRYRRAARRCRAAAAILTSIVVSDA